MSAKPIVYHIPVCPFSQRLEILLAQKGLQDAVEFRVVDITRPRDPALLAKTGGSTALPVLETADGRILKESLVILRYLDETIGETRIRRADPVEHAIEEMMIAHESAFTAAGYIMVMNRDQSQKPKLCEKLTEIYALLNAFLVAQNPDGTFLFERFGLAETVFTPFFMRFWFLDYYEQFALPDTAAFARVRKWQQACLASEFAQQVTREEIIKVYYDYAVGAGNGALPDGRTRSSFAFEPHWRDRPWPPTDKYERIASDRELGLLPGGGNRGATCLGHNTSTGGTGPPHARG